MENDNCVEKYLKRIEVNQPNKELNEEYLIQLHIDQHRGGVCYQMNGLFSIILKKLNYNVQIIPCDVYNYDKKCYLDGYSHASLCVTLNNGGKFLCDVGFLRDYLTPLFFRTDCIQFAINGFFRLTKTEDGLYYKIERGFLNEDDNISLPISSSPQTHIIDINPERIKWVISYRFPIDFPERSTKLEDFKDTCPYIIHSPEVILNHCTMCHIHTYKPLIGSYGIVGKEYCEWIIKNGIEIRKHSPISDDDDNELKKLLKEKFNLIIERKLKLADESTKMI